MITDKDQARILLKSAKQEILRMHGWSTKDYSARISETKKGLKLTINLLVAKKGFKTIYDYLVDKVNVIHVHSDTVTSKTIFAQIDSVIEEEVKKGNDNGFIFGIEWKVYPTEGDRKIATATMRYMNNLYDCSIN